MFLVFGIYDLFYFFTGPIAALGNETNPPFLIAGGMLLVFVISYLLGSVNCALLISRIFYKDDVREHGSGNAGTTNVLRTYGKKAAIFTFIGDGLKGVLSVCLASLLFAGIPLYLQDAAYLAAFACIFGHIFPCFAHFRGGKGFATLAMSILVLNPVIFLILAVIFFTLVLTSKYVSLGSVMVALFYPVIFSMFELRLKPGLLELHPDLPNLLPHGIAVLLTIAIGVLITWAHRGNLKRISNRTERKLILGKKADQEEANGGNR